jgi:hypothetical protein
VNRVFRRHAAGWAAAGLAVTVLGTVASIVALALTVDAPDQIRVGLVGILATVLPTASWAPP